ncbi:ATP-dependent DNA helicase RecG [Methyloversatilis thermotolerans]|uniref:ATP-dependent DNA helicase RecG n=1 Tax=Methyloversatilis thermotolerans TaxID=1346290 RepID=UPI000366437E|nr:ATP-dependent DNA helicase RecG [Methyloversatilis thermotolerans]
MTTRSEALAEALDRMGLGSDAALVLHFPLRYEDETRITPVALARAGQPVQVEVEVTQCEVKFRPRRQLVVTAADDSGTVTLRFFNFYPSQQKQLAPGKRVRLFGDINPGFFGAEMLHPRVRSVGEDSPLPDRLTPVYPATAGLSQANLRRAIDDALERTDLSDSLPDALRRHYALVPFGAAVQALHRPRPGESLRDLDERLAPAWRRIKFDELLAQQLSLKRAHAARRDRDAPVLPQPVDGAGTLIERFLAGLPFALTGAQTRAWIEIAADLAQHWPMQRLLQGDVGSGKTVVAALACLRAVEAGYQAAFMAPTEILAEQHYRKLAEWLAPLGVQVAWLSGSLKARDKRAMKEAIASGAAPVAVGTHALIEDAVDFARLGVAVIDEQHRFGVRQRLALRAKAGDVSPHQLMMSATPIPRTLAMSYYADLDVSVIDQLPPGRTPVLTKLIAAARRDQVVSRVRDACAAGAQAYWVCPLIEESETLQLQTALDTHAQLVAACPELAVGLVHGRMKPDEKAAVMAGFVAGDTHLLVATTVIEVGVDVPNASLMVIEHAERFGLSQLHQLRGRVGRGSRESACVLLYEGPLSQTARERLRVIHAYTDGFMIAAEDLKLRGPGEFIGSRQSGQPLLRFADLVVDEGLVEQAREAADTLLRDHVAAADLHLSRWLAGREDLLKA